MQMEAKSYMRVALCSSMFLPQEEKNYKSLATRPLTLISLILFPVCPDFSVRDANRPAEVAQAVNKVRQGSR